MKLNPRTALQVLAAALPLALGSVIFVRGRDLKVTSEMRAALLSGDYGRVRRLAPVVPDPNMHAAGRGITPLLCALWNNDVATARLLVSRGADVNEASGADTPLRVAVAKIDVETVRFLLAHGADPWAPVIDADLFAGHAPTVLSEAGACYNTLTHFRQGRPYVECVDPTALRRRLLILPLLQKAARGKPSST